MNAERPCDLCGGTSRRHLYDVNGYEIVECRTCGLVFVATLVAPEDLITLYDEPYYESPDAVGYGGYSEAEARKRHHDRTLLDEIEKLGRRGAMLEVGCAYGFFLDEARSRGWRVRGVEPSVHAADYARQKLGLDVSSTPFTDLPVEPESLDAIALWDVIEHLPNPRETVQSAREWLRFGGVIAISTGDVRSLSARIHGADWSLMTPPWHQFYFSRSTLRRLLEESGFEVVRLHGDGAVAIDPGARRARISGVPARLLGNPTVTRAARRLGAGSIMFVYARRGRR